MGWPWPAAFPRPPYEVDPIGYSRGRPEPKEGRSRDFPLPLDSASHCSSIGWVKTFRTTGQARWGSALTRWALPLGSNRTAFSLCLFQRGWLWLSALANLWATSHYPSSSQHFPHPTSQSLLNTQKVPTVLLGSWLLKPWDGKYYHVEQDGMRGGQTHEEVGYRWRTSTPLVENPHPIMERGY